MKQRTTRRVKRLWSGGFDIDTIEKSFLTFKILIMCAENARRISNKGKRITKAQS